MTLIFKRRQRSKSLSLFGAQHRFSRQRASELRESSQPSLVQMRYLDSLRANMNYYYSRNGVYSDRRPSYEGQRARKRSKSLNAIQEQGRSNTFCYADIRQLQKAVNGESRWAATPPSGSAKKTVRNFEPPGHSDSENKIINISEMIKNAQNHQKYMASASKLKS